MKRVLAATAAALALIVAGAAPAAGRADEQNADVATADIAFAFESCSGDTVVFAATLHTVARVGTSSDGGLHLVAHSQIHGEGVGVPSADIYQINENFASETANFRQDEDGTVSFEITSVNSVVAVSRGALDNTRVFMLTHVTVNANGEMTATVDNARADCTG